MCLRERCFEILSNEYNIEFEKGSENVDWELVEREIESSIERFYLADISSFGDAIKPLLNDIYFVVIAKDQRTDHIIGFVMLAITPALPYGDIKLMHAAVVDQDREIQKMLIGSIFKIIPSIQRIFTGVRITNQRIIDQYSALRFSPDQKPVQDASHKTAHSDRWALLEYRADRSDILQKTAQILE